MFNDKDKIEILNSIVHQAVAGSFEVWCQLQRLNEPNPPYVIEEAAIAIELGIQDRIDYIVVVTASEEIRIERTMKRDNCTKEKVMERMNNQVSEKERLSHADSIIKNDDFPNLECQVRAVNDNILKTIKERRTLTF